MPRPARAALALVAACAWVGGCDWGYGEPVDHAGFESARLHEDGARCVFALHDVVYRPAEGIRAFPDGGVPHYDVDRHVLGVVDVRDGAARILVDVRNRDWLDGSGGFHVAGVRGDWALVGQGGQRDDYAFDHVWWQLSLASGALARLPLADALAAHGRDLSRAELVDTDFTLILVTAKGADAPQEIWSRLADGTLRRLAVTDHYYGAAEGQIWWYDVSARAGARTDYRSGATVLERRANFAMPRSDPAAACGPSGDRRALVFQQKVAGSWRDRPLAVAPDDLR